IEALFRSDHYFSVDGIRGRGALDAWGTITALGAITSSLRLGTLVSPASFRHPSVLAKPVTTADHVSGGRVELGLGTGRWGVQPGRARRGGGPGPRGGHRPGVPRRGAGADPLLRDGAGAGRPRRGRRARAGRSARRVAPVGGGRRRTGGDGVRRDGRAGRRAP